ncbi:hypothetical protein KQI74_03695 [Paenibacillus barcinonensis]|uniref:hypothetical protein n=1 Tax=Paenibacillus barcinonensis TaxID=198119 RepID=UPI001C111743|nr:hypothetical protein [Paenibacillus barcinonensis]MBU5351369.1 hypothetical protein [Paenibacillus barcinonensis]
MSHNNEESKSNKSNANNSEKISLTDLVGILSHSIPVEIQEQTKDKTFDQVREEAITKHFQEQYEKFNLSLEIDNETK